jgi:hypothetical protein
MTATRKIRNCTAAAIVAIPMASGITFFWLFFSYFSSHPGAPQPDKGLIHALNNHGSYVFIPDSESTGMSFLMIAFAVGFFLAIAIIPKEFVLPPANSPRWAHLREWPRQNRSPDYRNKRHHAHFYFGLLCNHLVRWISYRWICGVTPRCFGSSLVTANSKQPAGRKTVAMAAFRAKADIAN